MKPTFLLLVVLLFACQSKTNVATNSSAPGVATKPFIGMQYTEFTSMCVQEQFPGDHIGKTETASGLTVTHSLIRTDDRSKNDCVGTFTFVDFKLKTIQQSS